MQCSILCTSEHESRQFSEREESTSGGGEVLRDHRGAADLQRKWPRASDHEGTGELPEGSIGIGQDGVRMRGSRVLEERGVHIRAYRDTSYGSASKGASRVVEQLQHDSKDATNQRTIRSRVVGRDNVQIGASELRNVVLARHRSRVHRIHRVLENGVSRSQEPPRLDNTASNRRDREGACLDHIQISGHSLGLGLDWLAQNDFVRHPEFTNVDRGALEAVGSDLVRLLLLLFDPQLSSVLRLLPF